MPLVVSSLTVRKIVPSASTDAKAPWASLVSTIHSRNGRRHERELVVYRVAQEALTNALRHANASTIKLTLETRHGNVRLSVRDDGLGLPEPLTTRHGIRGMRERSLLIGATLTVANAAPGTEVILDVPSA